jgi:branched-chain amino acid transport system ATP-binding protein
MTTMLKLRGISAGYNKGKVLQDVNLELPPGQCIVIIGRNGVGKTTLMRVISGMLLPAEGKIEVASRNITNAAVDQRVKMGISLVPEGRHLFSGLNVADNIMLGAVSRKLNSAQLKEEYTSVLALFPELNDFQEAMAGSLSGGQQQMVAIARALMAKPEYLLLDEPSTGLSPKLSRRIWSILKELKTRGVGILLVEQFIRQALEISDKVYMMEKGEFIWNGDAKDPKLKDDQFIQEYMGMKTNTV